MTVDAVGSDILNYIRKVRSTILGMKLALIRGDDEFEEETTSDNAGDIMVDSALRVHCSKPRGSLSSGIQKDLLQPVLAV